MFYLCWKILKSDDKDRVLEAIQNILKRIALRDDRNTTKTNGYQSTKKTM